MNQPVTPLQNVRPQAKYQLYIGGQWVDSVSGRTMPSENPATGDVLSQIPLANAEDVEAAVSAAEKGFAQWRKT